MADIEIEIDPNGGMGVQQDLTAATNATWHQYFETSYDGQPYPLAQHTMLMQLRTDADAQDVALELSSGDQTLRTPEEGRLEILVPLSRMSSVPPGQYAYDLVAWQGAAYLRILYGSVTIVRGVTRIPT